MLIDASHALGEYIAHGAKFPAVKSYLPIPTIEHELPLVMHGESPKKDISWSLASYTYTRQLVQELTKSSDPPTFIVCAGGYNKRRAYTHNKAWARK